MSLRASKPVPPTLRAAFEADKGHALRHKRLGIERLAELLGTTPATLYKWIEAESMPAKSLIGWQHLTGASNVVRYLASREGGVVIAVPAGRKAMSEDVHVLQETLNGAIGALLAYMTGDLDRDATLGKLSLGLENLAWHRENVRKSDQPELDLGGE
ncbi:MAG: hypothetical protein RBS05_05865 [Zoogloea oleivorans]|jgi:hypothetical protein|uniref:hypothetical protein n=1 Tax=Zoogloea oleivorans TaxID=1552750 RepID=UPI002A3670FA|nr:hypothetical protein [Zoogloea oleivorans]MDY0035423.1 hypothetical protein [Zoogloea oleivorans]